MLEGLWKPITPGEIKAAKLDLSIAPGPENLTPRQLRAVSVNVLVKVFNLMMSCERLPKHIMDARAMFIPKKPDAVDPSDFRPITNIFSALSTLFHRILAKRIDSAVEFSEEQRAFRAGIDGCGDITVLLDSILRSRYDLNKSTYIATLDIAKVFPSVEKSSIL